MGVRQVLLICFFCLTMCIAKAQNYSRTAIPINVQIGLSFANFEERTGNDIHQDIGYFLQLGSGYSVHLNERWTVLSELQTSIHTYNFRVANSDINLSNLNVRAQSGLSRSFPLKKNNFSNLHIGLTGGFSFFQPDIVRYDVQESTQPNFAKAETLNNPFAGFEVGLTQYQGKNKMEIGLMANYHFYNSPAVTFNFNSANSSASAKTKGDYVAFFLRFHLSLPEPKAELKQVSNADQEKINARSNRAPKSYKFRQSRVKLKLKDNAQIDGDTVSIQFNGRWIAKNVAIADESQTFIIYLNNGINELLLYAENEGTVSPNTASLKIISGLRRKQLTTSTSLKRNELILLEL